MKELVNICLLCQCESFHKDSTYVLAILHVLEHVRAVLDDSLQNFLVAFHAAPDLSQLIQEAGENLLMAARKTEELPFAPLQPLLNMGPGSESDGKG